jgi:hypothetical protein
MAFVLYELVQNCWDTGATEVRVSLQPITKRRGIVELSVIDNDPDGFRNLDHAYTLFAESERKHDAARRGRFNLGVKLILAVCESAEIRSMKCTIVFDGNRWSSRKRREFGTEFHGLIRMTRAEMDEILSAARLLLPPVTTYVNGDRLDSYRPLKTFEAKLATEIADSDGVLRRTRRKCKVKVYNPSNEIAYLYEMGIPIVEIEFPWSIEVMQKVPLNIDRDNVTPAYPREIFVHVLNEMPGHSEPDRASLPSVLEALSDERLSAETVNVIIEHQYGKKRAIYDPSDLEANHQLVSQGYNLIRGGSFSADAWKSIKSAEAALPSGQIAPTYKPYGSNGKPAQYLSRSEWTVGMSNIADFADCLAIKLTGQQIEICFEKERRDSPFAANYGNRSLTFNIDRLGREWFDRTRNDETVLDLLIHELSHEYASNHLDAKFHEAATRLGAKAVRLAIVNPELFRDI